MEQKEFGRIAAFIDNNKSAVLVGAAAVFLSLSVLTIFLGQTATTAVYAVGAFGLILVALPGSIEHLKFGTLEMKVRRAEQAVAEAKALTKLIAEISIPLAHHSEGWARTAPSTLQIKDLVIPRALETAKQLGVAVSQEIQEHDYFNTCQDYVNIIIHLREGNSERMRIIDKLRNKNIPTSIDEVEPPADFRRIIDEVGFMTDAVSQYLDDYQYYYENRRHRDVNRWLKRAQWSYDKAEPSDRPQAKK